MAGILDFLGDALRKQYAQGAPYREAIGGLLQGDPTKFGLLAQEFNRKAQTPEGALDIALNFAPLGITAFHGSPATFDKFDLSKIGTGDGSNAYGYGLYFSDSPNVAEKYRKALSGVLGSASNKLKLNGKVLENLTDAQRRAYEIIARDGRKNALSTAKELESQGFDASHIRNALNSTKGKDITLVQNEGNLYKVDIDDNSIPNMLDWDKSILQQPEIIKKLKNAGDVELNKLGINSNFTIKNTNNELTGEKLYDVLTTYNSQKEASNFLKKLGVSGIRYFNNPTSVSDKTLNYVVFDPEMIKILERKKGLLAD